jgi:hypothetical protein
MCTWPHGNVTKATPQSMSILDRPTISLDIYADKNLKKYLFRNQQPISERGTNHTIKKLIDENKVVPDGIFIKCPSKV